MKKEKPFKLETELCTAFIKALPKSWTAYPETAGWDILLVRGSDGCQIGVQAKLKLNAAVLTQAIEEYSGSWYHHTGPDYRAVLVPPGETGMERICAHIGVTVLSLSDDNWNRYRGDVDPKWRVTPRLPGSEHWQEDNWHECLPLKRHALPEYVPDVIAGDRAPLQLTYWKIKAIKVCILLARRGYLTRLDFKHIGMDHRRWIAKDYGWLTIDSVRKVYVAGPRLPDLKAQHPRNWDEIEADAAKWMPPDLPLAPHQPMLAVSA